MTGSAADAGAKSPDGSSREARSDGELDLRREVEGRRVAQVPNESEEQRLLHELRGYQTELESQNEELRQAQVALEASQARYLDLYTAAPVGFLTVGLHGRVLTCNQRAAELLQLPLAMTQRRRITDFMSPENADVFEAHRARVLAEGGTITIELEMRRAGGKPFAAELTMNRARESTDGSFICRIAMTDVTERRAMQNDLARLAAIVTSADQAILSEDLEGDVTTWNAGAERLFGYSAAEAVGHNIQILLPSDRRGEAAGIRMRVRGRSTVAEESTRVRRDGTLVPVFVAAAPIFNANGWVVGVSHIIRDISEQVKARQEVTRLLDNLRSADRRKDDFIATLAHELRNPLAPIRNAAAVMRFAPNLDPKLEWCRDVIARQVSHMAALLEDLLDVSRLTRDRITLHLDRVELGAAIAQAIEINRPMIESRGHRLDVQLPSRPLEVEGDLTRLTQVFGNLLNNAAKYTDPNGEISVRAEERGADVVVRVHDTGIGIDPANLASIFELFSQLNPAGEGPEGGLGIGLALVKGLVDRHGGTIFAYSDGLGRGSEFVVSLPLARSMVHQIDGDTDLYVQRHGAGGGSLRVLVVDDNVDAAETMAMLLRSAHHDVRTATGGEHAIEVASEYRPHLIVLDLGMPGVSGYEVARRVRQESWGGEMELVACTGWGQEEDRRRSHEAGFDHHLVKPVSVDAVLQLLARLETGEPT